MAMPEAILFGNSYGITAFLEKSSLIEEQQPNGIAHVLVDHTTMLLQDLSLVPENIAPRP